MLLMSSFSVVDFKWREVLGTESNEKDIKHHQIKNFILQVFLVLWSKIGSKRIMELGGGLSP
jgi:hypothetical protein